MPKSQQNHRYSRQRPVSCQFCKSRKLRCSREAPCSNCVSRGLDCDLEDHTKDLTGNSEVASSEILERLSKLEKLLATTSSEQAKSVRQYSIGRDTRPPELHTPLVSPSPAQPPKIQGIAKDVAWLESLYIGDDLPQGKIPCGRIVFKTCSAHQILDTQSYTFQYGSQSDLGTEPARCIWLPQYSEAQILLDKYIRDVNHIHPVTHVPSLPSLVEEVYTTLNEQGRVKPGNILLLLSIFASATHSWVRRDCESDVFRLSSEANKQAPFWVRAFYDVLDASQRSTSVSLEGIQGMIIVSFTIANLEGFSRGCRSLLSTGILLAREQGLHRIDHPSNSETASSARAEIGRRVWWYLCASDWLVAARFTHGSEFAYSCHPRQMMTHRPLNINDEEVFDGMSRMGKPLSYPTTMSYSLQRLRLAEIARNTVDRNSIATARINGPSHDDVMDIDTELQTAINEAPVFFSMTKQELMATYDLRPMQVNDIVHQRYMLHFFLHAQRCQIHLPYFTRGFTDPTYSTSREICIESARIIIQAQLDMESLDVCTATRFKFTGLLLGVFMASIVLLTDLCINSSFPAREKQRREVAEALRILEEAKDDSETAVKFVDSLMHILKKHKVARPVIAHKRAPQHEDDDQQFQTASTLDVTGPTLMTPVTSARTANSFGTDVDAPCHMVGSYGDLGDNLVVNATLEGGDLSSYFNELAEGLEQGADVGNFDWDNIFSDLSSTFT